MQQYGTSYKRGTLFFPKKIRKEVYIVYAFVRAADQLVDTPHVVLADARAALDHMEKETKAARWWTTPSDPLIAEFVAVAHKYSFSREWVVAFFAAMRLDTTKHRYATYTELGEYMHGSAEVIWLMMEAIIGSVGTREHVISAAKKLGEAMQYTNFLRDVREDLVEYNRIYLPEERLQAHGLTSDDLIWFANWVPVTDRWRVFCEQEVVFCRELYQEALAGVKLLAKQWRFAVRVASFLYAGILRKLEHIWFDQFSRDAHTTRREKCRLFLGAWKTYSAR